MESKTLVEFRIDLDTGEQVAVFADMFDSKRSTFHGYVPSDQHVDMWLDWLQEKTRQSTREECSNVVNRLESIGYRLVTVPSSLVDAPN